MSWQVPWRAADNMVEGVKRKLLRNSLYNSASYASGLFLNLVLTPLLVFYLGLEGFGIYALLTGLFGYYSLLDLGLGQGVVKFVAQHMAQNNRTAAIQYISAALIVQTVAGLLGLCAVWVFSSEIVQLLNISRDFQEVARTGLLISSVGFFLTMLLGSFSSVLQGMQRYEIIGRTNAVFSLLTLVVIGGAVVFGGQLFEVILLSVVLSCLNSAAFLVFTKRYLPDLVISVRLSSSVIKDLISYSGYVLISRVSNVFNNYFLRFIVSAFWGPQAVTLFVVPLRLVYAAQGGLGSLSGILFPFASEAASTDRLEELRKVYLKASTYVTSLSFPIFLFLIIFAWPVLFIWMGKELADQSWVVLVVLGCGVLLSSLTLVPTNAALGLGRSREIALFSLGVVLLGIVSSIAFTSWWGIGGTAWAILLTQSLALPFVWYVTTKILDIDWKHFASQVLRVQQLPAAVFVGTGLALSGFIRMWNPDGAVVPLLIGLMLVVLYYGILHARLVISLREILTALTGSNVPQQ